MWSGLSSASEQHFLLVLTLVSVELRRCAVIPSCVTLSSCICAGASIQVCTCKYWHQSGLSVSISGTGPRGNTGSDLLPCYMKFSRSGGIPWDCCRSRGIMKDMKKITALEERIAEMRGRSVMMMTLTPKSFEMMKN